MKKSKAEEIPYSDIPEPLKDWNQTKYPEFTRSRFLKRVSGGSSRWGIFISVFINPFPIEDEKKFEVVIHSEQMSAEIGMVEIFSTDNEDELRENLEELIPVLLKITRKE